MNALIQAWIDAEAKVAEARAAADQAQEDADVAAPPTRLRPATSRDIVEGAILWYPDWDERKWAMVGEVLRPGDPWKAYSSHDGCRYGLEGAFVEIDASGVAPAAPLPPGWQPCRCSLHPPGSVCDNACTRGVAPAAPLRQSSNQRDEKE
jgi:hypothetical protein